MIKSINHYGLGNPKSAVCRIIKSLMFAFEVDILKIRDSSEGVTLTIRPPESIRRERPTYKLRIPFIDGIGGRKILDYSVCALESYVPHPLSLEILEFKY